MSFYYKTVYQRLGHGGRSMNQNAKILMATLFLLLIILFAPFAYHFDLGPGPDSIDAIMWHYIDSSWFSGFRLRDPLRYLPYVIFRLLFLLQFIRYMMGRSSRKTTVLAAAYSELHVAILSLPVYLSWYFELGFFLAPGGDPLLPIFLPLPILFILVVLLMLFQRRLIFGDR